MSFHSDLGGWRYQTSAEVLGILLARASTRSLGAVIRERLFDPLGMHDAAFSVPPAKLARLTTSYLANPEVARSISMTPQKGGEWSRPPAFESAGGAVNEAVDAALARRPGRRPGG